MSICARWQDFCRNNEWVSDIFTVMGVGLLYLTVWGLLQGHSAVVGWLSVDPAMRLPAVILAAGIDVMAILGLFCLGSGKCAKDEGCFHTFKGRRNGVDATRAFRNWVLHMENVGKKHR